MRGRAGIAGPLSLGCRVEAHSDLGAIGDVHLVARLQALCQRLHSRILHVDSVGHAVRAGKGDLLPSFAAETIVTRAAPVTLREFGVSDPAVPTGGEPGVAIRAATASLKVTVSVAGLNSSEVGNIRPRDDRGLPSLRCPQHHYAGGHVHRNDGSHELLSVDRDSGCGAGRRLASTEGANHAHAEREQ